MVPFTFNPRGVSASLTSVNDSVLRGKAMKTKTEIERERYIAVYIYIYIYICVNINRQL